MPRVPTYDGGQVRPTVQPNFQQSDNGANPRDFGGGFGEGLQRLGGAALEVFQQEKAKADNTALNDAVAQLSTAENHFEDPNNPDGKYAYKGADALTVHDKLLPEYDRIAGEIGGKIKSRRAQEAFGQMVVQRRGAFERSLNQYAVGEKNQYDAQAFTAFLSTGADDLAKAVATGDPNAAMFESNLIHGIDAHATSQGWPSQLSEATKAKALSGVYRNVIENTLASDPVAADAQLQKYGSKLTFSDASDLSAKLKPLREDAQAEGIVDHVLTGGVQPGAVARNSDELADQLLPCIQRLETGGLGDKAATAVSPKGAIGQHQMLPATAAAAAQRLGIAFHPDDLKDPTKSKVLAREEVRYLCEKFGNDQEAVLAAYNMGAGAAEGWAAGKPYQTQSGATWHPRFPKDPEAMPTETRNYVRQGLAGGPTPDRANVLESLNSIDNPTLRHKALSIYAERVAVETAARQDRDRATMESVYTKVWDARDSGKSLRQVLTSDEYAYVVANNHAEALTSQLTPSAESNTTSLDQVGAINQQFFYAAGNGTPQQQAKARAFIAEFNPYDVTKWQLTNEQRKTLGNQRTEFAAHDPKAMADVTATGKLVNEAMFNTYGYLDHPKGSEADMQFNRFQAGLTASIQAFKADPRNKGAMPTQEQVQKMADALTLQTRDGHRAFETFTVPDVGDVIDSGKGVGGGTHNVEVPAADAALIRQAYPNATDDQVRLAYMRHHARSAK